MRLSADATARLICGDLTSVLRHVSATVAVVHHAPHWTSVSEPVCTGHGQLLLAG